MASRNARWYDRILPQLPPEIRDDFFVHAASELQRHSPWLFLAMLVNSVIAMATGAEQAHWSVRILLPGIMGAFCLTSIIALRKDWDFAENPWRARKFLRESALSSCFGAIICTAWCILSWIVAPADARMHFPIILVMGALATAYCLANVKVGAIANLVIDLIPISLLMMASGNPAEFAAAISLLLAGLFQLRMIRAHHRRVIELLVLQKQARQQANTDVMTGLANRRALLELAHSPECASQNCRLALIDIDHFKAINDEFGHDMGDKVLCEMAEIIASFAPPGIIPARIGGEEFALFGPADALGDAVTVALLEHVAEADMPHARRLTVCIGTASGQAGDPKRWDALYHHADAALYKAKRAGRNRIMPEPELLPSPIEVAA